MDGLDGEGWIWIGFNGITDRTWICSKGTSKVNDSL